MDSTRLHEDTLNSSKHFPTLLASDPERTSYFTLDASKGEFSNMPHSCLCRSECLYSKGGWLLLHQRDQRDVMLCVLFLFNTTTGEIIDLPSIDMCGVFCFSLTSGKPDCIFYVARGEHGFIIRMIRRPGKGEWEEYPFNFVLDSPYHLKGAVAIRKWLLCYGHGGSSILFNLTDPSWKHLEISSCSGVWYAMESEGDFLLACASSRPYGLETLSFFRLDWNSLTWDAMYDRELENRVWFLGQPQSFCLRGSKAMVYLLKSSSFEEDLSQSTIITNSCKNTSSVFSVESSSNVSTIGTNSCGSTRDIDTPGIARSTKICKIIRFSCGSSRHVDTPGIAGSTKIRKIGIPLRFSVIEDCLPGDPVFVNVSLFKLCNGGQSFKGFLLPKPFPSKVFHWVDISTCILEQLSS